MCGEASDVARAAGAHIGISGWRYSPWRGDFYPDGLRQKDELAFAAARFSTIEINGSFYSLQRPESYARWYDAVPNDFVFAVKGSRYITHMLRLREVHSALANLFASGVFELREKLGPFLWQLPPTLAFDPELLARFFDLLPRSGTEAAALARRHDERVEGRASLDISARTTVRHALEVRHPSFVVPEFVELLRAHEIALVVADTAGKWPLIEDVTADFVYVRLHGDQKIYESGYTEPALEIWAEKTTRWLRGDSRSGARTASRTASPRVRRDVFVYFDNDIKVHAPYDAVSLTEKVAARVGSRHRGGAEGLGMPRSLPRDGAARQSRQRGGARPGSRGSSVH